MLHILWPVVLLGFACSVSAQYPYYYSDGSLTGSVIAGIVIAVVFGLLALSFCCLAGMRRRQGRPMLGGFRQGPSLSDPDDAIEVGATNANGQGYNYPPGALYPTTTNPPPPPYQSKESYAVRANGNESQEDYTAPPPPPDEPPTAHIQDNDRRV